MSHLNEDLCFPKSMLSTLISSEQITNGVQTIFLTEESGGNIHNNENENSYFISKNVKELEISSDLNYVILESLDNLDLLCNIGFKIKKLLVLELSKNLESNNHTLLEDKDLSHIDFIEFTESNWFKIERCKFNIVHFSNMEIKRMYIDESDFKEIRFINSSIVNSYFSCNIEKLYLEYVFLKDTKFYCDIKEFVHKYLVLYQLNVVEEANFKEYFANIKLDSFDEIYPSDYKEMNMVMKRNFHKDKTTFPSIVKLKYKYSKNVLFDYMDETFVEAYYKDEKKEASVKRIDENTICLTNFTFDHRCNYSNAIESLLKNLKGDFNKVILKHCYIYNNIDIFTLQLSKKLIHVFDDCRIDLTQRKLIDTNRLIISELHSDHKQNVEFHNSYIENLGLFRGFINIIRIHNCVLYENNTNYPERYYRIDSFTESDIFVLKHADFRFKNVVIYHDHNMKLFLNINENLNGRSFCGNIKIIANKYSENPKISYSIKTSFNYLNGLNFETNNYKIEEFEFLSSKFMNDSLSYNMNIFKNYNFEYVYITDNFLDSLINMKQKSIDRLVILPIILHRENKPREGMIQFALDTNVEYISMIDILIYKEPIISELLIEISMHKTNFVNLILTKSCIENPYDKIYCNSEANIDSVQDHFSHMTNIMRSNVYLNIKKNLDINEFNDRFTEYRLNSDYDEKISTKFKISIRNTSDNKKYKIPFIVLGMEDLHIEILNIERFLLGNTIFGKDNRIEKMFLTSCEFDEDSVIPKLQEKYPNTQIELNDDKKN